VEAIVSARGERAFADFSDFARRINPRAVNKRVLESLAAAGAFDDIERDRARAVAAMDAVLATAQRTFDAAALGQSELFGGPAAPERLVLPDVPTWLPAERLQREYDAIGFFLSGHPLDDYAGVLKNMRVPSWAEFSRQVKSGVTAGKVAATVVSRAERRTKTGNKMGIIGLSDPSGHYEAVIFAEGLQQFRDLLEPGRPVLLVMTAEAQGDEVRARIQSVETLDAAAARVQKGLRIFLRDGLPLDAVAKRLDGKGDGEVNVVLLLDAGAEVEVRLPGRYKVSPQIAGAIKAVPGVVEVQAM
jgi:DNA polymerase-3 subunit alpha